MRPEAPVRTAVLARLTGWLQQAAKRHIVLPILALALLGIGWTLTLRMIDAERSAAMDAARNSARELITTYEAQVARSLDAIDQTLKMLRYAVEMNGPQRAFATLDERGLLPAGFISSIADEQGNVIASNLPLDRKRSVAGRDYFTFHHNRRGDDLYISQVMREPFVTTPRLHFSRRIRNAQGRFAGVVLLAVEPAYFTSGYEFARHGQHGLLGIVGVDGVFRARRSGDEIGWGQRPPELGEGDILAPGSADGVRRFLSVRRVEGYPVYAAAGLSYKEQMEPVEDRLRIVLLAAWGVTIVVLGFLALVSVWAWQSKRTRSRIRIDRARTEERLQWMAHYDELTGLPNRTLIGRRLDAAIALASQEREQLAVAFIDLDGFKLVNDGLGHQVGDELLRIVSRRMRQAVGEDSTLGRFGGDEFVLLMPAVKGIDCISGVLEKLRQAVMRPVELGGQSIRVSAGVGAALYPRDGADANALLKNADAALYHAKELGSNTVQFYRSEINSRHEETIKLLDFLRAALEARQFSLLYQPKVDLRTGRVFGVEALLRWTHPELGSVAPARFIPLAEESGLIVQLGEWVLQTACAQNQAWRAAGLPPISVSVNVSARQFAEKHLVERVAEALRRSGLPPDALEIEVTESLIMRDMPQAVARMGELKGMGVSLSVDDFGTGYSSLSSLKSFPISALKIDKSFVSDLDTNPDDRAIAMAVVALGHQLNLRVIAEGVETEPQYRFLRDNGCDEMQGYLFSRPLPAGEIAAMLARPVRFELPAAGESPG